VKAAREVAADVMDDREFQRLADRITDVLRDEDTSLTRAARDRDRAAPRDVSHVDSERLRGELPAEGGFRRALSGRQRKLRSATKNRVMAAAPASQHRAVRTMLTDENPQQWQRVNRSLHTAAGDVQVLDDSDRVTVQRLDRAIQSYERLNDRTHKVYATVELPDTHRDITKPEDLPGNLRPGAVVAFDQFTLTRHNLHETPGHDRARHLVLEIVTSRGMYLGRSDSLEDTTHILPRGMSMEVASAQYATYETQSGGFDERLVLQLRER
jgi:predicted secreted protein